MVEHSTLQMQMAVDHALQTGARRIGICLFPPRMLPGIKLHISRAQYLIDYECPANVEMRLWVDRDKPSPQAFAEWHRQFRPDILVSSNIEIQKYLQNLPGAGKPARTLWLDKMHRTEPGVMVKRFEAGRTGVGLLQSLLFTGTFGIPTIPATTMIPPYWAE